MFYHIACIDIGWTRVEPGPTMTISSLQLSTNRQHHAATSENMRHDHDAQLCSDFRESSSGCDKSLAGRQLHNL